MLDRRMKTFLTLYDELSYSRTAELLNMTQPGVSQHIKRLEQELGAKLFTLEGRYVKRTREAEIVKRHVDRILVEEKLMLDELGHEDGVHLRVGATKTIGEYVLVPHLKRFMASPSHSMDYVIDNTERLLPMLENGELDFAVIEGVFDRASYGWHLYKKEKFVGVCSVRHRFAGKKVRLEDIFEETLLLREKGSGTRRIFEEALRKKGHTVEEFSRTTALGNFGVIMEMLMGGNAITFAYKPIADQKSELAVFTVEDFDLEGEFNFVYMNKDTAEEKIKTFFFG